MPPPKTVELNQTINYQGVTFKFISMGKTSEFQGKSAPSDKDFLVLHAEAKNNTSGQVIVFYDEELRLLSEEGESITPESCKIENNFDAGAESQGHFLFLVKKEAKKFKLQFGKQSGPKSELAFEFPEND